MLLRYFSPDRKWRRPACIGNLHHNSSTCNADFDGTGKLQQIFRGHLILVHFLAADGHSYHPQPERRRLLLVALPSLCSTAPPLSQVAALHGSFTNAGAGAHEARLASLTTPKQLCFLHRNSLVVSIIKADATTQLPSPRCNLL